MKKIIKKLCRDCSHYKEIRNATDIFPYDFRKCKKFENKVFKDAELYPEIDITYHTTFISRYDSKLCGSEGKYFTKKSN